mgnify:FL=1|jgi:hypothetical protein
MNETQTITLLNVSSGLGLTAAADQFSPYDAESDNYIVEIKNRRAYYQDKMLEAYKLFANYQQAQLKGKQFLYVVTDSEGIWVYNVTKHIDTILKGSPRALQCPAQTDFSNNSKITKYVYTLPESLAVKIN